MSIIEQAKVELAVINFGEDDSKVMLEILEIFFGQWDSGGADSSAAPVLTRLISGLPLAPLTGDDSEWFDPLGGGVMLQNMRCSSVFKTWCKPDGNHSDVAGEGALKLNDLDNPEWDGTFPYDPSTKHPPSPVVEFGA